MLTGTHFNYYIVCRRKLWLFANGIQMEHTSELVSIGRAIHETSYAERSNRFTELAIDGIKIDFYDPIRRIVHEVKKTNKLEEAHRWQVKYYLYVLEQHGIVDPSGILEYPKLRITEKVILTEEDRAEIARMTDEIKSIIEEDTCPPLTTRKGTCKQCSYYEFCYTNELIE